MEYTRILHKSKSYHVVVCCLSIFCAHDVVGALKALPSYLESIGYLRVRGLVLDASSAGHHSVVDANLFVLRKLRRHVKMDMSKNSWSAHRYYANLNLTMLLSAVFWSVVCHDVVGVLRALLLCLESVGYLCVCGHVLKHHLPSIIASWMHIWYVAVDAPWSRFLDLLGVERRRMCWWCPCCGLACVLANFFG